MREFDYHRPASVDAAAALLTPDSALLAGGHTLIPAIKSRLRMPDALVDLNAVPGLDRIEASGDRLWVGAMARHAAVADSDTVKGAIPSLAKLAAGIGDPQVRNRGTIGGSLANNDPAADYPAAVLGLDAVVETNRGSHAADDFFQGMFATALDEGEIVTRVGFRVPQAGAYAKFRHPASRYAVVGIYVAKFAEGHRVAVTGAGPGVFRWAEAEAALDGGSALDALTLDPADLNTDIHAAADYRAHLCVVMLQRAALELT
jgi:aerobic carbon-monoxide dehydrogenase medium subunit